MAGVCADRFGSWLIGRSRRFLLTVAACFFMMYLGVFWSVKGTYSNAVPETIALLAETMEASSNVSTSAGRLRGRVELLDSLPAFVNTSILRCNSTSAHVDMGPCKDSLRFRSTDNPVTALVSFPGSGNTWTRYLLEQSTGILTGSKYCDRTLKRFFYAENVVSSNVIAVKTHLGPGGANLRQDANLGLQRDKYDRAIVLVRNPRDAIISEANRYFNQRHPDKHTSVLKKEFFQSEQWDNFVVRSAYRWVSLYNYWLSPTLPLPVLVVQYEDMVNNLEVELKRMLQFLDIEYSEEDVACVLANPYGRFKRSKHIDFDPYTSQQSKLIMKYVSALAPTLGKYGIVYE